MDTEREKRKKRMKDILVSVIYTDICVCDMCV